MAKFLKDVKGVDSQPEDYILDDLMNLAYNSPEPSELRKIAENIGDGLDSFFEDQNIHATIEEAKLSNKRVCELEAAIWEVQDILNKAFEANEPQELILKALDKLGIANT